MSAFNPGRARLLGSLLVVIASARIVATYRILSNTTDEPAHLAAGIEWLENGTYTYEDQHPPLARVAGAIGLHLAGARWGHGRDMYFEGYRLLGTGRRYVHNLFYSRAAMLPFFWIACAVVFLWAWRCAGCPAAVLATLIFTTAPAVLGHAGLATTDMALTAFTGAAVLSGLVWAERPGWLRAAVFGACCGLAVASKFSALLFLPPALMVVYVWRRPALKSLLVAIPVALFVIWAAYRFSSPAVFFSGIRAVWEHNRAGHPAWLLGHRSQRGFWYYYLVVALVKTPLAMLILTCLAALRIRRIGFAFAFAGLVVAVASLGSINIGIRHVLPMYLGLSVCCGVAAAEFWRERGWPVRALLAGLLCWQVVAGVRVHPDYIAYTNELAGDRPDRILADSDLDWSQDMGRLAKRIFQLGVPEFTFKINSPGYLAGNEFPRFVQMPDGDKPRPGWNAVSITPWRISGEPKWAETATPRERIGRGILLFYFPEDSDAEPVGSPFSENQAALGRRVGAPVKGFGGRNDGN